MAIYSWTYANAKLKGYRLDYQTRGGCRELWEVVKNADAILPKIAVCLISEDQRNLYPEQELSWFAGYLDGVKREKYVVAVGGTQDQLLGEQISGGGFRTQFCVFACVFTDGDIHLYRRNENMFQTLKENLLKIQKTGVEEENNRDISCFMDADFSDYILTESRKYTGVKRVNILVSNEENDNQVWRRSLERPVMIRAAIQESAEKFLRLFPDGLCTVTGGQDQFYTLSQYKQMSNGIRKKEALQGELTLQKKLQTPKKGTITIREYIIQLLEDYPIPPDGNYGKNLIECVTLVSQHDKLKGKKITREYIKSKVSHYLLFDSFELQREIKKLNSTQRTKRK